MTPIRSVATAWLDLIKADVGTIDHALDVLLIGSLFAPGYDLDPTTLTQIDQGVDAGLGSIHVIAAARIVTRDPVSAQFRIVIPPPAGGWSWALQADHPLGVAVYGFLLTFTGSNGDQLAGGKAAELLDTPVTLYNIGDELVIPEVAFNFPTPMAF